MTEAPKPSQTNPSQFNRSDSIVRGSDAATVGVGIRHHQYVPPSPKHDPSDPEVTDTTDRLDEWIDKPSIVDQIQNAHHWKLDRIEVKVFDFSVKDEVVAYSTLMTACNKPDTNCVVMSQDRQFCAQTGNWKVLVELQFVKFRRLLAKKDEQNSRR